eukprot:3351896-Pyramimonas_sp.AAC.1
MTQRPRSSGKSIGETSVRYARRWRQERSRGRKLRVPDGEGVHAVLRAPRVGAQAQSFGGAAPALEQGP